jgi:hypothetical protein
LPAGNREARGPNEIVAVLRLTRSIDAGKRRHVDDPANRRGGLDDVAGLCCAEQNGSHGDAVSGRDLEQF